MSLNGSDRQHDPMLGRPRDPLPRPLGYGDPAGTIRLAGRGYPIGRCREMAPADVMETPINHERFTQMSTTQPGPYHPQGQPAYQTPGGPAVVPPPEAPAKQRNTLAIVALVLAVLGFAFAVIEGAYILGWLMLPVAFVLSIVALAQKNRPKKMAVAALVISIVGTIAGGIAFLTSTARIIDESFGSATASVVATPSAEEPAASEDAVESEEAVAEETEVSAPADDAAGQGTRENPLPLGTAISTDEWEVTVNSFTPDATEAVLAENEFNEAPEEGTVYALANVTLTRVAAEAGTAFEVSVAYVTASGNVVTSTDAMVVAPDELGYDELYEGASITGNVALAIPAGDAGTVRITPGLFADDVFFAIS